MVNSSNKIEHLVRSSAMFLLAGYDSGFDSVAGRCLLTIALCLMLIMVFCLFRASGKRDVIRNVLESGDDYLFWPSFMILWCAISYSKAISIVPHLVLLAVVLVVEALRFILSKR